jgi:hypothetical protein
MISVAAISIVAISSLLAGCSSTGPQRVASGVTLQSVPLLEQPRLVVGSAGLVRVGRRADIGVVIANRSKTLDAREATIVLAVVDNEGKPIAGRSRELLSIPAGTTVAVTASLELDAGSVVGGVVERVTLQDAAVSRAVPPMPLRTAAVTIRRTGDEVVVTGRTEPADVYPVPYSVDAVLLDEAGNFVAAAHGELRPKSGVESQFTARGASPKGLDPGVLRAVVTILPTAGD